MAEILGYLKDVAITVAAFTTAIVAWRGLNSWRKELKGNAEFETARSLIKSTYKLRDQLSNCRAPFIHGGEFHPDVDINNITPEVAAKNYGYIYTNRWNPVWEALQEFDTNTLEAEALWGDEIKDKVQKLRQCANTLSASIEAYISNQASGGCEFESDPGFGVKVKADVHGASAESENTLSISIKNAIEGIENQIRPHLKRN